jgi:quinone-modifying oxidoreductase subunit QmoC
MTGHLSTPFYMSRKESELRAAFLRQLDLIPDGHKIRQCIQCGTCTGSCPVSYAMDITPRKAIALVRAGEIESILHSNTVWICTSCYACTVRCPSGVRITDMMYAFKRLAMEKKVYPKGLPIHILSSSFVKTVNRYGRNQELRLLTRYGLKAMTLNLLRNIPLAVRLMWRGRIPISIGSIKGRDQLSGIIGRASGQHQRPATT